MAKIQLTKENIIALEATEKVNEIFDANTGEKVIDRAFDWILPIPILVDLKDIYDINEIRIFDLQDWSGGTSLKVYAGNDPFDLKFVYEDTLKNANIWNNKTVDLKSIRYLRLDATGVKSWFSEVEIHGVKVGDVPAPAPVNFTPPNYIMKKRIGGKCFIDDPWDKLEQVFGFINDYSNWQWFESTENDYRFTNSALGNFIKWRDHLKARGLDWIPVVKESPVWFRKAANGIVQKPMVQPIREPYDYPEQKLDVHKPETHAAVFKDWLEFLEEYLKAIQPDELHLFNETDKLWDGLKSWSKPFQAAAVMIQSQKVRDRVSPHTKLCLGGLAGLNLDYFKAMKIYCDKYNGGKFCSDAVVVHHYCNNQGGQMTDLENPPSSRFGISPEDDDFRSKGKEIVDWAHNVAGVPADLMEFGFDTNPGSRQTAGSENRQRDWIIRNYAAAIEAGFTRVAMYMFRDPGKPTSDGLYSTSGLVTQKGEWKEKPSFFALKEYKEKVQHLRYIGETRQGEAYIQQYAEGESAVYMYWTNKGTAPVNINGNNLTAGETPKYLASGATPVDPEDPIDPPNPNINMNYSYSSDRSNPQPLTNGTVIKPGNVFIFADKPGTFTLKKDGANVRPPQREGNDPYDMGGTNEAGPKSEWTAKPVNLPAGDYELTFEGAVITFKVGDETPPVGEKPKVNLTVSKTATEIKISYEADPEKVDVSITGVQ